RRLVLVYRFGPLFSAAFEPFDLLNGPAREERIFRAGCFSAPMGVAWITIAVQRSFALGARGASHTPGRHRGLAAMSCPDTQRFSDGGTRRGGPDDTQQSLRRACRGRCLVRRDDAARYGIRPSLGQRRT